MKRLNRQFAKLAFVFIFILALSSSSCGFTNNKTSSDAGSVGTVNSSFLDAAGNPVVPAGKTPGFNTVKQLIFSPNCAACHMNGNSSGNVSLDNYASVKAALDQIYNAVVVTHSMPQNGTLSAAGQTFVTAWYQAGGPENDLGTGSTGGTSSSCVPAAGVDPSFYDSHCNVVLSAVRYPGYNTVKALVFQNQCLGCHYAGNPNYKHPLPLFDTFAEATGKDSDGDSMLEDIIKVTLKGMSMPPKGPLANTNQSIISAWYQAGAPEVDVLKQNLPTPPNPAPTPSPIPTTSQTTPSGTVVIPSGAIPGYDTVKALVFAPYCIRCHNSNDDSDGVTLDSYAGATGTQPDPAGTVLQRITKEINAGKMPPTGELQIPADLIPVLKSWLSANGPASDTPAAH